ncbi:hypothetical protein ACJMK2_036981 [Sinanodonta woodiana]|uniref:Uncharacterized protein n=1 Tax=Sinanodonta woodiana TaxID=1069815 RepID=A0ABD3WKY3_SINWO
MGSKVICSSLHAGHLHRFIDRVACCVKRGWQRNDFCMFKIILVGNFGVGKSSLILRFSDDIFADKCINTIGADFKIRTVELDGKMIKLCMTSFEDLKTWAHVLDCYADQKSIRMIVGNKSDLTRKRKVTYITAKTFADQYGLTYMETSAKTAANVEQTFMTMTEKLMTQEKVLHIKPNKILIGETTKANNIGSCC